MRSRRNPEVIAGLINGSGVLVRCSDPRVVGVFITTGQKDITFPPDFQVISIQTSPVGAYVSAPQNTPAGSQTYRLYTDTNAGAAVNADVYFTAIGVRK